MLEIQRMQFKDQAGAEALALPFLRDATHMDILQVELRPLAVSLNSFNGFIHLQDGKKYFFKTHIESDNVIDEFYNASLLAEAHYPVVKPIFSSTESGRQLLVYEVIDAPSVFDVAWDIEQGNTQQLATLTKAQNEADQLLFRIYEETLQGISPEVNTKAPIHQLFYHRLTGGRLERFYGEGQSIQFPDVLLPMSRVKQLRWTINGQVYQKTFGDLIQQAIDMLNPYQSVMSVVGHGDAHNGNVFLTEMPDARLLYFDPAFAGRHHPLLDLTKPLFHNVFAMWMYFPQIKNDLTPVGYHLEGDQIHVQYDYHLPQVRIMFLESKVDHCLKPLLHILKRQNALPENWRMFLKSALFCCPSLTMNLTDSVKFPPKISLLGLAMAVEMGGESSGQKSQIDQILDDVENSLRS